MLDRILIVAEHLKGQLTDVTFEMLGIGRKLADELGIPLHAVIIGDSVAAMARDLGCADMAYAYEHPKCVMICPDIASAVLQDMLSQSPNVLILVAGTNLSQGVGAKLAALLNKPLVNFCTDIQVTEGNIEFTSKLFGGKILADGHLTDNQGIVNIYPGAFPPDPGRSDKPAEVTSLDLTLPEVKISFTEYVEAEKSDVDITVKDVLVGVGRGFHSEDELEIASELAETVNGAVCASRPVVDQEWLPMNRQVGKSGMIVKPKLYIAAGISGAPEHVEGMQSSETVIAINTDPEAPIFNVSDYGVCEDLNDILPALTEEIKNRQKRD